MASVNKAYLLTTDVRNYFGKPMPQMTFIQTLDYSMKCCKNSSGQIFGSPMPVILTVSIRSNEKNVASTFLERIKSFEAFDFSVLYDPKLDEGFKLSSFDSGMVFSGYVVDVKESKERVSTNSKEEEQMLVSIGIQLTSLTILAEERNKDLNLLLFKN